MHPSPRIRTRDIVCTMCEGRGHLAKICPNHYYTHKDINSFESKVTVDNALREEVKSESNVSFTSLSFSNKEERLGESDANRDELPMLAKKLVKEVEVKPVQETPPKDEPRVSNEPMPIENLHGFEKETKEHSNKWPLPKLVTVEEDLCKGIKAMEDNPHEKITFCLEEEETHLREVPLISTFSIPIPLLEPEYTSKVESHSLKVTFEYRTRYSCIHQSFIAQFMPYRMHLV